MTPLIALLLGLIVLAMVLFTWEPWPAEVTGLALMLALIFSGMLTAEDAFAGFGSGTIMLLLGLLILTAALMRTGVVDLVARAVLRRAGANPNRLLLTMMVTVAGLSAFMSNTAATALFIPITLGIARRTHTSPSKLLMPLAFASILSSPVTLISSSSNLVISGLMTQNGLPPLGMFEMSLVGIVITVVGIAYMYIVGRRLIPERISPDELGDSFNMREYFTEIRVLPESDMIGKNLSEIGLGKELGLTLIQVYRNRQPYRGPIQEFRIQEGDLLLVGAKRDELLKIKDTTGIDLEADTKLTENQPDDTDTPDLAEVIVLPRSPLVGRTLESTRFRDRYNLEVLGINRGKETILNKIGQTVLRPGDLMLIQGARDRLAALEDYHLFRVIGEVQGQRANLPRAPLAVGLFVLVLLASSLNWVSLPVAALTGAVIAFLTKAIRPDEAYREVEWKALILIGSMLALGAAMQNTGAAEYVAGLIVGALGHAQPLWLLAGFFLLTLILTQPMSNQAAAVVVIPIALQTAVQLGLNPRTFAIMIAVAASCSYLTPLEPSCLMVYAPGRYRFTDFVRVGSILTLLIFALSLVLVPMIWPL